MMMMSELLWNNILNKNYGTVFFVCGIVLDRNRNLINEFIAFSSINLSRLKFVLSLRLNAQIVFEMQSSLSAYNECLISDRNVCTSFGCNTKSY